MTAAVDGQHIFHCTSFHFGKYPEQTFAKFIGNGSHVYRKKKNPNGNEENEVSMTCYTP
jgi:hypothetical protein